MKHIVRCLSNEGSFLIITRSFLAIMRSLGFEHFEGLGRCDDIHNSDHKKVQRAEDIY